LKDTLKLYSENDFLISIPLSVYPTIPHLSYEPQVDLGVLKVGSQAEHPIKISNKGSLPVELTLEPLIKGVTARISPSKLNISAGSEKCVTLFVHSSETLEFEGTVEIHPQILGESKIEVVGSFSEFSQFVADCDGK
jgi:hypothetical protein